MSSRPEWPAASLLLPSFVLLSACASMKWTPITRTASPRSEAQVVEFLKFPIERPYHEIGLIRDTGSTDDVPSPDHKEDLRKFASERGCHALVLRKRYKERGGDYEEGYSVWSCVVWGEATPEEKAAATAELEKLGIHDERPRLVKMDGRPDDAMQELATSMSAVDVQSCKTGDEVGQGQVRVTVGPGGLVATAEVFEGPFKGTPIGDCVASKFRAIRLKERGDARSAERRFTIK